MGVVLEFKIPGVNLVLLHQRALVRDYALALIGEGQLLMPCLSTSNGVKFPPGFSARSASKNYKTINRWFNVNSGRYPTYGVLHVQLAPGGRLLGVVVGDDHLRAFADSGNLTSYLPEIANA